MKDEIFDLIKREEKRQAETLMLIPSENYTYPEVREAVGSVLMHKYAEGYPGKRYYQGNKINDEIEVLAQERAKKLFGVPFANVQPYSGSPANMAIYFALLEPGDKIMGMALSSGGHLTHGHPKITFAGKYLTPVQYTVGKDGWIDYEAVEEMAIREKPKLIICGYTAYPRTIDFKRFGEIAEKVGCWLSADISHIAGLIVGKAHSSPVPYADVIMTTTHKTLRGPRGAIIMVTEKGLSRDPDLGKKIDRAVFPGLQGGPHLHTIAAVAVALRRAQGEEFKDYAKQVVKNAEILSETLIKGGLDLVTGGTDNHLMLIDLRSCGIDGKVSAEKLEEEGIVVNKNAVPGDDNPPARPAGIRLGTPAVTARGMKEGQMKEIGEMIVDVLRYNKKVEEKVRKLCRQFPIV